MNIKFRLYSKQLKEYVNPNDLHLTMSFDGDIFSYEEGKLVTDQYVIEQFAGAKDVDGKEIYAGDRLSFTCLGMSYDRVVVFNNGCFLADDGHDDDNFEFLDDYDYKVIGNIHE